MALCALPIAFLWYRLIAHLSVEWSANTQYAYGWAVPFLCLYLLWNRIQKSEVSSQSPEGGDAKAEISSFSFQHFSISAFVLCTFLYAPTRLIEVANPDWRVVSWALALEVVGLTLLFLHFSFQLSIFNIPTALTSTLQRCNASAPPSPAPLSAFQRVSISAFVFPLCFFLVAVPWLRPVEHPLIFGLTQANATVAVELVNTMGVPAMRHGNVIEVGSGMVGVDEACSGIRSFQATLMISLFLGELYRLSVLRRAVLCLSGFALSFIFNVGRTSLLTWVAAREGVPAISKWHDPAGVSILLGCFLGLWVVGVWLRKGKGRSRCSENKGQRAEDSGQTTDHTPRTADRRPWKYRSQNIQDPASSLQPPAFQLSAFCFRLCAVSLLAWLVLVEISLAAWYGGAGQARSAEVKWRLAWPTNKASFVWLPVSEKAKGLLRINDGQSARWQESDGSVWQMVFFRWDAGRVWANIIGDHNPSICLPYSGLEVESFEHVRMPPIRSHDLRFQRYQLRQGDGPSYVYYCIWQDGVTEQEFVSERVSVRDRLKGVLRQARSRGMQALEVAIWGIPDSARADTLLREQLERLIQDSPAG